MPGIEDAYYLLSLIQIRFKIAVASAVALKGTAPFNGTTPFDAMRQKRLIPLSHMGNMARETSFLRETAPGYGMIRDANQIEYTVVTSMQA